MFRASLYPSSGVQKWTNRPLMMYNTGRIVLDFQRRGRFVCTCWAWRDDIQDARSNEIRTINFIIPVNIRYMFRSYWPPWSIHCVIFKTQNKMRIRIYLNSEISQTVQSVLNFVIQSYFYPFLVSCATTVWIKQTNSKSNFMEIRPLVAELYFYPFLISCATKG
jgi:hypothetical protein